MTPRAATPLEPCPFCGATLRPNHELWADHPHNDCWLADSPIFEKDWPSWNTRAPSSPLVPPTPGEVVVKDIELELREILVSSTGYWDRAAIDKAVKAILAAGWVRGSSSPLVGELTFGDGIRAAAQIARDSGFEFLANRIRRLEDSALARAKERG